MSNKAKKSLYGKFDEVTDALVDSNRSTKGKKPDIITAQHSTAQHSTAQHSTAQHSTAQHSTAQHSTKKPKAKSQKPKA